VCENAIKERLLFRVNKNADSAYFETTLIEDTNTETIDYEAMVGSRIESYHYGCVKTTWHTVT